MNQFSTAAAKKTAGSSRARDASDSSSTHVLVVEDDRTVAADVQRLLRELGFHSCAAASAADALTRAREHAPDLAITDVSFNGNADGAATARALREQFGTAIIFLTAQADHAAIESARQAEPYAYLVKPVSAFAIKAAVEIALDRRAREVELRARESALAQKVGHLACALNHVPVAMQLEDASRRVLHVNPAFCSIFGFEESPASFGGTDGAGLVARIQSRCSSPHVFSLIADTVRHAPEPVTGIPFTLRDGRILELEHIPIFDEERRPNGRLWTFRDVSEHERQRLELEQVADGRQRALLTDELTGLNSRRGFFQLAGTHLKLHRRRAQTAVVFFVDVNDLKEINDRHGHGAGDEAIREVANAMRGTFRTTDLLARLSGDEFVVLAMLPQDEIGQVAKKLTSRLDHFNSTAGRPYQLAVSVGAAEYREGESLDTVLARADDAMYRQKKVRRQPREA
ncbi:MAG: diguanylate cyclase [Proteobacteria bacterium]|nr:diguanylate cyclase [Pseudomonadota bacterium]